MIRFVLAAALVVAAAFPASAVDEDPDAVSEEEREVIVVRGERPEGMTLRRYVHEFVIEIADPPSSNNGFARWDDRVCVGVENVERAAAQYIADRVSEVAANVGLEPEGPGCRPNIIIVFASDGRALAAHMVEERPLMFRPFGGVGGTTQGLEALEKFKTSDAAVRWWQVMMVVDELGNPALTLPGSLNGTPTVRAANSRITNSVHDELVATYMIVDASQMAGANWRQAADYLAMVALAQVDPSARPGGYDSILNLFSSSRPAEGLTEWDELYLSSLYELNTRLFPRQQRGALVSLITRGQRELEDGE